MKRYTSSNKQYSQINIIFGEKPKYWLHYVIFYFYPAASSKLTLKTPLEEDERNMFKVNNKDTRTTPLAFF